MTQTMVNSACTLKLSLNEIEVEVKIGLFDGKPDE
jgi:hypothetical protein